MNDAPMQVTVILDKHSSMEPVCADVESSVRELARKHPEVQFTLVELDRTRLGDTTPPTTSRLVDASPEGLERKEGRWVKKDLAHGPS